MPPTSPETGYGYIEIGDDYQNMNNIGIAIKRFTEKPNYNKAKEMVSSGKYLWNSGIFLAKASVIINEIKNYRLDLHDLCVKSLSGKRDLNFLRLDKDPFLNVQIFLLILP